MCSVGSEICARVAIDAFDYLDAPPAKVSGVEGNKLTVAFDKAGEKKVIDSFVEKA